MQRALVERARDGDLEAFAQLATAAFPRLGRVADLILRDRDGAQDAVQEALLMAWRDLKALRDPDAWDAWLHRLTVRACYRIARRERRRIRFEVHAIPDDGSPSGGDTSSEVVDRDWLGHELERLDVEQRAVLVLHYHLDLPVAEVAEILDIPYGTAASRLHRGLEAMRASLAAGRATTERSVGRRPA
jgi:RNA polymerase sigma-70 factor (ECF subfamily)